MKDKVDSNGSMTSQGSEDVHHYLELADRHIKSESFSELDDLIDSLNENPIQLEFLEECALLLKRANYLGNAYRLFDRVIAANPRSGRSLMAAGQILVTAQQHDRARNYLEKALSLDPEGLDPKLGLLKLARATGDLYECQECLKSLDGEDIPDANILDFTFACITTASYSRLLPLENTLDIIEEAPVSELCNILGYPAIRAMNHSRENMSKFGNLQKKWCDFALEQAHQSPLIKEESPRGGRIKLAFFGLASIPMLRALIYQVLRKIDRQKFETSLLFVLARQTDVAGVSAELQELVDSESLDYFRIFETEDDRELAELIQKEHIDILIDLNGLQQAGTRLGALAWQPARYQLTWAGTPTNCGLQTLDFQILDPFSVPTEAEFQTDSPMIMERGWVCYGSFPDFEIADTLASDKNGYVTFGVNTTPNKISPHCVLTWAEILKQSENSRLVFMHKEYEPLVIKNNILGFFRAFQLEDRVDFISSETVNREHMKWYNGIDVLLDRAPISGGMGLMEALYMGIPAVSYYAAPVHCRMAYSQLNFLGLQDLCCENMEEYAVKAISIAGDITRRKQLRHQLRRKINEETNFTNINAFVAELEEKLVALNTRVS